MLFVKNKSQKNLKNKLFNRSGLCHLCLKYIPIPLYHIESIGITKTGGTLFRPLFFLSVLGQLNYVGASHQVWHILVVVMFYWWHQTAVYIMHFRHSQACPAHTSSS